MVPATKEEMKELSKEEIWDRIENAGEVEVSVESVGRGEGGGSVENVGGFVHTGELLKRDDWVYGSMGDEEGSGDKDVEVSNGYGVCGEVWPKGLVRRSQRRSMRSIRRRF